MLARLVPEICKLHGDWFKWWKGMLFECEQPFVGGALRDDAKKGCEGDYTNPGCWLIF